MAEKITMPFKTFAFGDATCPGCGLPIDSRDVTERIWDHPTPGTRPLGVHGIHKRCGFVFTIEFEREQT